MVTRIGQNKNDARTMRIVTDIRLWSYLMDGQKRLSRRLSRIEAFYDLIHRQQARLAEGKDFLAENVSQLTRLWHWNRDTTAAFLDNLEQLGAITTEAVGNQKSVRLNYVIEKKNGPGASQNPSEPLSPSSANDST